MNKQQSNSTSRHEILVDYSENPDILRIIQCYIQLKIFDHYLMKNILHDIKMSNPNITDYVVDDIKHIVTTYANGRYGRGGKRYNGGVLEIKFTNVNGPELVNKLNTCIKVFFSDLYGINNIENICVKI